MFVVGFDYKTGMEKAFSTVNPYLEIRISIGIVSKAGLDPNAEFKPPIMGLFLVPYMENIISSWEFTAGMYKRFSISTSGNTFYQHGIVNSAAKTQGCFCSTNPMLGI